MLHIAVIGANGVGKTALIQRMTCGAWPRDYISNDGFSAGFTAETNKGLIRVTFTETKYDNIHANINGIIIMFDVTNKQSYRVAREIYNKVSHICKSIVICGNKVDDSAARTVKQKNIMFPRKVNAVYHEISAKSLYNFERPLLSIIQDHLGYDSVFYFQNEELI